MVPGGGSAGGPRGSGGGSRGNLLVLEECLKTGRFPEEVAEIFRPAAARSLWVWQTGCAQGSGVSQSSGGLLKVPPWLPEVFISTLSRFRCVKVGDDRRSSRRTCWSFRGGFLCLDLIISEGTRLRFWRRSVSSRSNSGCRKLRPFMCLDWKSE